VSPRKRSLNAIVLDTTSKKSFDRFGVASDWRTKQQRCTSSPAGQTYFGVQSKDDLEDFSRIWVRRSMTESNIYLPVGMSDVRTAFDLDQKCRCCASLAVTSGPFHDMLGNRECHILLGDDIKAWKITQPVGVVAFCYTELQRSTNSIFCADTTMYSNRWP